jgi:outer membrane protein
MQEISNNPASKKLTFGIILNIISLIAIVILFILYFQGQNEKKISPTYQDIGSTSGLRIAFVNSDTILAHYNLAIAKGKELETRSNMMENELQSKQQQYEKDVAYFQEQVNSNQLSEKSAQFIYGQLMEEQQKLYELQQQYTNQLADMELSVNLMLLDSVTNFLERYNLRKGYDYILGHNAMSNLLLKNDKYNITKEVIDGMNNEYKMP